MSVFSQRKADLSGRVEGIWIIVFKPEAGGLLSKCGYEELALSLCGCDGSLHASHDLVRPHHLIVFVINDVVVAEVIGGKIGPLLIRRRIARFATAVDQ